MSLTAVPTILVVDDNPSVLRFTTTVMAACGYQVTSAESGPGALNLLGGLTPDLILLDLNMPEMDGFEVLERLKARPELAEVPIVVLTGKDSDEDRDRALDLGAIAFLTKPLSATALAMRISDILAGPAEPDLAEPDLADPDPAAETP